MNGIKNEDLLALQSYVTAKDQSLYENVSESTVILDLTHSNLQQRHIEIRFDLHDTIDDLRQRIYQKTGTPHSFQHLHLYSAGGQLFQEIPPNVDTHRKLGFYSLCHGMRVHCVDLNPHSGSKGGGYENINLVEKYKMSDDAYDQRKGTLRDWNRQQQKKDPNFNLQQHAKNHRELADAKRLAKLNLPLPSNFEYNAKGQVVRKQQQKSQEKEYFGKDTIAGIQVGDRCEVQPGERRGQVAFVNEISDLGSGGYWVGIIFDEPVGKTNGSHKGKTYFECPDKYGGFVRGKNINVGDFPERDIFSDDSSDEDEL